MKTQTLVLATIIAAAATLTFGDIVQADKLGHKKQTFVRTENYPRPPYSGATYYIYERDGKVICTKLEVCNKFGDCEKTYKKGSFKEDLDIETGEPYGKTDAVLIPASKLRKHVCLTKFKLIK
ncbi:MAG: hypothetical protein WBD16_10110 [Pyrinomonadaceae bacterium]